MSQLLILDLDDATLNHLRKRAEEHGHSIESEAKAIIMRALPAMEIPCGDATSEFQSRLDELRSLENGWLDGNGRALPASGIDWLAKAFRSQYADGLPVPHLYPTPEGGVQAEWSFENVEFSLEIDLEHHHGRWHGLSVETGDEETRELNLDQESNWQWLADQIMRRKAHSLSMYRSTFLHAERRASTVSPNG